MTLASESAAHEEWTRLSPASALAFTARVVNSSLRLDDVLRTVVRLSCEVLTADRATILLLDGQQRLVPAASDGRVDDPRALARFREMLPVSLTALPQALELLGKPEAVAIPDVAASPLVPAVWREAFGLKSLLIAPIVTHGVVLGALVADYGVRRLSFSSNEVLTIEGIAACTSTAVRNARLYEAALGRAASLDESLQITAQLNAATTPGAVCEVALEGLVRMLGGTTASAHRYDGTSLTTLASRAGGHPAPGVHRLTARERTALARVSTGPADSATQLRRIGPFRELPDGSATVLLPLSDSIAPGFLVVTCPQEPAADLWQVAKSVAGQILLALDRARLSEETEQRLAELASAQRSLAVVQERERIARDLHDTLGQTLFGLGLQLAQCEGAATGDLRAKLGKARGATDAAALQLREAIHALAFLRKGSPSLQRSLRALAREMPKGVTVLVNCTGKAVAVPPEKAEALVRVAREGLVNVGRHSRATDVAVALRYDRQQVELVITDNGTGLAQRSAGAGNGLHFGLRSMQQRLQEVDGALSFKNVAPHGLRLTATVPLP
ncbi:MAG: hypothetical protein JWP11_3111 [Frankiales bacterium]|nr:hypothetical protein [Frankiales bacterium]